MREPGDAEETLALLLPLLVLLIVLVLLLLVFLIALIALRRRRAIVLDDNGPTNLDREQELDEQGTWTAVEQSWLESSESATAAGYLRSKAWQEQYPPNSHPTEITLSQFLSIQEKGVSAWSFDPDYESNAGVFVTSRTELTFLADSIGMAANEGGGSCVQSNLPLPKINEVYYWECKMFEKPEATTVAIGLATKPFPTFRLPGWSKYSIGYFSSDGFKAHSYPFTSTSYGPPLQEGDVLGVGYRPRTGTVFFTRNGKKLEDAFVGLNKHNLFPTVGATGACQVHVNLGQAGFVFIEANVKKWGLAPMMGTLAPPPAYGSERGSILLESAVAPASGGAEGAMSHPHSDHLSRAAVVTTPARRHHGRSGRRRSDRQGQGSSTTATAAAAALGSPRSQPIRPSPLRHARQNSGLSSYTSAAINHASTSLAGATGKQGSSRRTEVNVGSEGSEGDRSLENPPTPGLLDISLHSLHAFPRRDSSEEDDEDEDGEGSDAGMSARRRQKRRRRDDGDDGQALRVGGASGSNSGASDQDALLSSEESLVSEEEIDEADMSAEGTRMVGLAPSASATSVLPPAYDPIDPHMYAPGVAEALLEDAFSQSNRSSGGRPIGASSQLQQAFNAGYPGSVSSSTGTGGRYEAARDAQRAQQASQARIAANGQRGGGGGASIWGWFTGANAPAQQQVGRAEQGLLANGSSTPGSPSRSRASPVPAPASRVLGNQGNQSQGSRRGAGVLR